MYFMAIELLFRDSISSRDSCRKTFSKTTNCNLIFKVFIINLISFILLNVGSISKPSFSFLLLFVYAFSFFFLMNLARSLLFYDSYIGLVQQRPHGDLCLLCYYFPLLLLLSPHIHFVYSAVSFLIS